MNITNVSSRLPMMAMRMNKKTKSANNVGNTKPRPPTAKRQPATTTATTGTTTTSTTRRRRKKKGQYCTGRRAAEEVLMEDVLDELCTRFIINVPQSEYESSTRLLFAIEEAYWFFVDFYDCSYIVSSSSSSSNRNGRSNSCRRNIESMDFATFADRLFAHYGPLRPYRSVLRPVIRDFYRYKFAIPCFGGIIVNETLDRVLLIKPYGGVQYKFPRGKIAKNETELECAIREVDEEVGFDMTEALADCGDSGFGDESCSQQQQQQQHQQHRFIEFSNRGQYTKLFVVTDVSERDTVFRTKTRNEVSEISWHSIHDILTAAAAASGVAGAAKNEEEEKGSVSPNYYVAVAPIVRKLQETILEPMKRKREVVRSSIGLEDGSVCVGNVEEAGTAMVVHHNGQHRVGALCPVPVGNSAHRVRNEGWGHSLGVDSSTTCIDTQQQQQAGRHKLKQPSSRHGSSGVSPEKKKKRRNHPSSQSHHGGHCNNNGGISDSNTRVAANRSTVAERQPAAIRILSRTSIGRQETQKQSSAFKFSFNREELLVGVIQ